LLNDDKLQQENRIFTIILRKKALGYLPLLFVGNSYEFFKAKHAKFKDSCFQGIHSSISVLVISEFNTIFSINTTSSSSSSNSGGGGGGGGEEFISTATFFNPSNVTMRDTFSELYLYTVKGLIKRIRGYEYIELAIYPSIRQASDPFGNVMIGFRRIDDYNEHEHISKSSLVIRVFLSRIQKSSQRLSLKPGAVVCLFDLSAVYLWGSFVGLAATSKTSLQILKFSNKQLDPSSAVAQLLKLSALNTNCVLYEAWKVLSFLRAECSLTLLPLKLFLNAVNIDDNDSDSDNNNRNNCRPFEKRFEKESRSLLALQCHRAVYMIEGAIGAPSVSAAPYDSSSARSHCKTIKDILQSQQPMNSVLLEFIDKRFYSLNKVRCGMDIDFFSAQLPMVSH
jgi:hypothetical protein